jgi:hypothetical protein
MCYIGHKTWFMGHKLGDLYIYLYIYTDFAVVGQNSERPRKMFNPLAPIKHDWLGNLVQ